MITNKSNPFDLHEKYTKPDGTRYGYVYHDCWFTDTGRDTTADGTRIVTRNATVQVTWVSLMRAVS